MAEVPQVGGPSNVPPQVDNSAFDAQLGSLIVSVGTPMLQFSMMQSKRIIDEGTAKIAENG